MVSLLIGRSWVQIPRRVSRHVPGSTAPDLYAHDKSITQSSKYIDHSHSIMPDTCNFEKAIQDNWKRTTTQPQINHPVHDQRHTSSHKSTVNLQSKSHDTHNFEKVILHQDNDTRNFETVIPGNGTYIEACKYGKKTFVFGTSMVKGIRVKEFNNNLTRCSSRIRSFPGATLKQLKHYVIPTLVDDTPDVVIIEGGCNDLRNGNAACRKMI